MRVRYSLRNVEESFLEQCRAGKVFWLGLMKLDDGETWGCVKKIEHLPLL